ncbi:MAG: beta-galactosidase [Pirellulales bacterium]|nr:beta-galactosidase [Pirellulales bacterium]
MKKIILSVVGFFSLLLPAQAEEPLFPFVVSYDAPHNVTNLSGWLHRPAGKYGFVKTDGDRLVVKQDGRAESQRFWATNFCFGACFPEEEQAERVAARLARLGINCVRMHHMDMYNIWGNATKKITPDPRQLDRLDYLVYQLKRHGVYTNLNLHVSRWLDAAEGFPDRDRRPTFDKGLDNFEPRMIELQKKYARDLLTHVNSYTKRAYTDEPAVAFVEINNENALFHEWNGGALDGLPEPYAGTFRKCWNAWLKKKYSTTQKLRAAWGSGLPAGQTLDDGSVAVLSKERMPKSPAVRNDLIQFLWDTERDYWQGMYRYLKDELHVQSLVGGTQVGWSPVCVQAGLDYLDAHAYWQHPYFPHRPWDLKDWRIRNVALVNSLAETLSSLAGRRVAGRVFTVSEYNHPAPNAYAAEGFPLLAAVGSLQGWNALYSFAYSHSADYEPAKIDGFFNINGDTAKLVHLPACAAMFLRGDVRPAEKTITADYSRETEMKILRENLSPWVLSTGKLGLPEWIAFQHGIALKITAKSSNLESRDQWSRKTPRSTVSDTGQIRWDATQPSSGYFLVDTPRTKLFTGFVRGRTFSLGDVELKIGTTRLDWATVSLVCRNGDGFGRPGRILIAATGWEQNQDWKLKKLPDNFVTLGDRWGHKPVLCEGVPAEIRLPVAAEKVKFYPLDESGNRRASIPISARGGKAVLRLDPKHHTVWYEVEIR